MFGEFECRYPLLPFNLAARLQVECRIRATLAFDDKIGIRLSGDHGRVHVDDAAWRRRAHVRWLPEKSQQIYCLTITQYRTACSIVCTRFVKCKSTDFPHWGWLEI